MVAKGWVAISNGWGVVCDLRLPKKNERLLPANEIDYTYTTNGNHVATAGGFRSISGLRPRSRARQAIRLPLAPLAAGWSSVIARLCRPQLTGSEY
jgi:hypothetical protein